ncbi:cobyric acid synthase [Jeotgalibacillus sp. ET6]|uniref:cobyric acid synthase n=1 Tax=Jeotgalibacillus sp. ET6 TaxID=3037260 RepID=UPI002418B004|nr:cobyric acid synthase [Jeotgalibacillus sp. ET6]MDG5471138.1 cobyric acid synthase [Jeotgalibacillus sp. ET6]
MKGIMLQGTSSDVGKSLIAALFCRLLVQDGIKTVPFKSQNMSNNSYVTADGLEIGRAQGVQAEAARVEASVWMNPILLKPQNDRDAEVVLFGKRVDSFSGMAYRSDFYKTAKKAIETSLNTLEESFEAIVIEGAGSPVEMNLLDRELVNMTVAEMADVPVLLVSDIERGGVFASISGTLSLLPEKDRSRVKGIIINKFRGDKALFDDGVKWIEEHTGLPVVGVLPKLSHHGIEQEDSLGVKALKAGRGDPSKALKIAVINLPYISNFTDIEVLVDEEDVSLQWVRRPEELTAQPDLLIIPGTKSVIHSLKQLKQNGWQKALKQLHKDGVWIMGICGGFQLMGKELIDPHGVDSGIAHSRENAFNLIPTKTIFEQNKTVIRRIGVILPLEKQPVVRVSGYEIHLGKTLMDPSFSSRALIVFENGEKDGIWAPEHRVIGTYLHDIFREKEARNYLLNEIRVSKGLNSSMGEDPKEDVYDDLVEKLKPHLDWEKIREIMGLPL